MSASVSLNLNVSDSTIFQYQMQMLAVKQTILRLKKFLPMALYVFYLIENFSSLSYYDEKTMKSSV